MERFRAKFGQAMHDWREAANATKKEAAALADVSDTTWLKLEGGEPGADRTLSKISKLMWADPGVWRQVLDTGEIPPFVLPEPVTLDAQLARINQRLDEMSEMIRRIAVQGEP